MGLFGAPNVDRLKTKGDVAGLVKALGYQKDQAVCVAAARALKEIGAPAVRPLMAALKKGKIGEARTVEQLVAMLMGRDGDPDVRIAAAASLGQIGAPAVKPLMEAVSANLGVLPNYRGLEAAVDALGQVGAPAVEPLIAWLKEGARAAAAEALSKTGWRPGQDEDGARYWMGRGEWDKCVAIGAPAVEPLIAALNEDGTRVAAAAAEALGKIGDDRAVEPLIAALNEDGTRAAAAKSLGKIGWRPGQDEEGARYWMGRNRWDKCVAIGSPAVEPLIAALKDSDLKESDRRKAAEALGKIGDARAVEPLMAALMSPSKKLLMAATAALGQIGVASVEPLIAALPDESVREAAVEALGQVGASSVEPLLAALKPPSARFLGVPYIPQAGEVLAATAALDKIGWRPGQDEDGARYWMGRGEWDKCVAIGVPAVEPLIATLVASAPGQTPWVTAAMVKRDREYFLRSAAVDALGQIGAPAVEPLIALLGNSNPNVREAAASALGQIGDVRALERLESLAARDTYSQETPGLNPLRFDHPGGDEEWLREPWEDTHEYPVRLTAVRAVREIRERSHQA